MSTNVVRVFFAFLILFLGSCVFGQVAQWEWARNISSSGHEEINDVVADRSTNEVYVVGEWRQDLSATFPGGANPSTDFSSPYGSTDGLVAKYDSAGNLIWAFKLGGATMIRQRPFPSILWDPYILQVISGPEPVISQEPPRIPLPPPWIIPPTKIFLLRNMIPMVHFNG